MQKSLAQKHEIAKEMILQQQIYEAQKEIDLGKSS